MDFQAFIDKHTWVDKPQGLVKFQFISDQHTLNMTEFQMAVDLIRSQPRQTFVFNGHAYMVVNSKGRFNNVIIQRYENTSGH